MTWPPRITVASVIEQDGRFLLVHEVSDGRQVYNQPAGHLEPGESLVEAAVRETLEETGWSVKPVATLGIRLYQSPNNGITYLRTTLVAEPLEHDPRRPLDADIIAPVWLSHGEILARREQLRSPMVLQVVEEYLAGVRYPLEVVDPGR